MARPTEEQLDAFADQGALVVEAPELGDGFAVYLRPLPFAAFREFVNGGVKADERANAQAQAIGSALLWPSRSELRRACELVPGLHGQVLNAIEMGAGKPDRAGRQDRWLRLDATLPDDELDAIGLDRETLLRLLADHPLPGQLRVCLVEDLKFALVVRRPRLAESTRLQGRLAAEFFDAAQDLAIDCTLWARLDGTVVERDAVGTALKRWPAVPPLVLLQPLLEMAKGEAVGAAKKLVRKGRPSVT
jgi:hypothetical protein